MRIRWLGWAMVGLLGWLLTTLPATEKEACPFVHGMVWAFCLHWLILILVTCLYLAGVG